MTDSMMTNKRKTARTYNNISQGEEKKAQRCEHFKKGYHHNTLIYCRYV